jgi:hypothetical protein
VSRERPLPLPTDTLLDPDDDRRDTRALRGASRVVHLQTFGIPVGAACAGFAAAVFLLLRS